MLRISGGGMRMWEAIYYFQKDAVTLLDQTRNKCSPDFEDEGSDLRNMTN